MAGGQSEEPGDRTWQVNPDAGTLQGWGAALREAAPGNLPESSPNATDARCDAPKTCADADLLSDGLDPAKLQAGNGLNNTPLPEYPTCLLARRC